MYEIGQNETFFALIGTILTYYFGKKSYLCKRFCQTKQAIYRNNKNNYNNK